MVVGCVIAIVNGREGVESSIDMVPSSSASQSDIKAEERGDISGEGVGRYDADGVAFRRIMACFQDLEPKCFRSLVLALLARALPKLWYSEESTLTNGPG